MVRGNNKKTVRGTELVFVSAEKEAGLCCVAGGPSASRAVLSAQARS